LRNFDSLLTKYLKHIFRSFIFSLKYRKQRIAKKQKMENFVILISYRPETRGIPQKITLRAKPEEYFIPQGNFLWNTPSERSINGILYRTFQK
jgi:hypothetical protein